MPIDAGTDSARLDSGADVGTRDSASDVASDLGNPDSGADAALDAGNDAAVADSSIGDAAMGCVPEAVTLIGAGRFRVGEFCDELFACAADVRDAARINSVAPHFDCVEAAVSGSSCSAWTCQYRNPRGPGTIDASEYAEVCAITVLAPTPRIDCRVFL